MKKEVITHKEPKSPISEIFRTLRTNIQFSNVKGGLHSILVTSTSPGEGKSWMAANLAVTFAQAGKKVILIDADMRKGRQFNIFNIPPTPGLSNYLSGINSNGGASNPNIITYIKETEVDNLYVIPAGSIPPNPSELLVSDQMTETMAQLEQVCDLIIFDGTPSDLVADSIILSRYVDTTLIVTAYKQTKMDLIKKIKRDIENVGGKIAGIIINKTPLSQKAYYSKYYYGGSTNKLKTNENKLNSKKIQNINDFENIKKDSNLEETIKRTEENKTRSEETIKEIQKILNSTEK